METAATPSVQVFAPPAPHFVGDGFRVHNFIPGSLPDGMRRMDPFLMLDYNSRHYFAPTDRPRGVGVHPHKGFETVTIAYKGRVAHHDSAGNHGVIEFTYVAVFQLHGYAAVGFLITSNHKHTAGFLIQTMT